MSDNTPPKADYNYEFLLLGHYIKYNLYLLSKSIIFSNIATKFDDYDKAIETTNYILSKLDLQKKDD